MDRKGQLVSNERRDTNKKRKDAESLLFLRLVEVGRAC
jgi:hypothetical protein